jgi:hypothetical protein
MNLDKESSEEIVVLLREAQSLCNKSLTVVKENEALGIVKVYGAARGELHGPSVRQCPRSYMGSPSRIEAPRNE